MRKTVEQVRAEIAEERERIRLKVEPEVEAHWRELEERQATDGEELRATVEVGRERRIAREAREAALVSGSPEEDNTMAIDTTTTTVPFSKEQQLHQAQPGQKKKSAHQRIQAEMKAVTDRKAAKKDVKNGTVKVVAKAAASNGSKPGKFDAEAKKKGVIIKAWKKGSQADPKNIETVFYVLVVGTRSRALPDNFVTLAAAKKACVAAGFPVKEEPKK